jgi:hypothetical protein
MRVNSGYEKRASHARKHGGANEEEKLGRRKKKLSDLTSILC